MSGLAGGLPEILPLSCRDKNLTFSGNAGVLKDVGLFLFPHPVPRLQIQVTVMTDDLLTNRFKLWSAIERYRGLVVAACECAIYQ